MFNRCEAAERTGLVWPTNPLPFPEMFDVVFAPKLNHRADTMRTALECIWHVQSPVIVETGGLRDVGNWAGDGQSTFLFDCFAELNSGTVWSVDIDPRVAEATKQVVSPRVHAVTSDSVKFLDMFSGRIDLLYLDSWDLNANEPLQAATHHLFEFCAAQKNLGPGSVVVVDDTWMVRGAPFGKGMLLAEYMRKTGRPVVTGEYQMVWRM